MRQDDEEIDDEGEADKEEKEEGDKCDEEDDDDANADDDADEVCSINTLGGQMRCLSAANSPGRETGTTRRRVFQAQPDKR